MMALVLSRGWTCSPWDHLGCPQLKREPVEGLVAMSALEVPRYDQSQNHNRVGVASKDAQEWMGQHDMVSLVLSPGWTQSP